MCTTGGNDLTREYLRELSKKFEMIITLFSGAWGEMKKPEAKYLVTLSL
jgi:hypothetical protein